MKSLSLAMAAMASTVILVGCVVAPAAPYGATYVAPPTYVAPAGVAYVAPTYASPGPGWVWDYHAHYGWGWRHPTYGWHRGWH